MAHYYPWMYQCITSHGLPTDPGYSNECWCGCETSWPGDEQIQGVMIGSCGPDHPSCLNQCTNYCASYDHTTNPRKRKPIIQGLYRRRGGKVSKNTNSRFSGRTQNNPKGKPKK